MRRLIALVRELPSSSRIGGGWSMAEELTALLLETTHELLRWTVAVNSKGHKFPKVYRVPRPYERREPQPRHRQATMGEVVATVADLGVSVEVVTV